MAESSGPPTHPPAGGAEPTTGDAPDLRTVLARLREIERKCRTLGERSEELAEHGPRIATIIEVLEGSSQVEALSYHALARQLFPVAQAFEALGFTTVGREVRYVERSLEQLAPAPNDAAAGERPAPSARPAPPPPPLEWGPAAPTEPLPLRERFRPTPVLTVLVIILIGACLAAWQFVRSELTSLEKQQAALLTPLPTATPRPSPTRPPLPPTPVHPASVERDALPAEASAARLSLRQGDLDSAVEHLGAAARVDPRHGMVLELAAEIMTALIEDSDHLAERARWNEAEEQLERARRIALRFELEDTAIEAARHRHAAMPRIDIVRPGEGQRLAELVGRDVEIVVRTGAPIDGTVSAVDNGLITLRRAKEVRGGLVYYQDEVPLTTVVEVRAQPRRP